MLLAFNENVQHSLNISVFAYKVNEYSWANNKSLTLNAMIVVTIFENI